jgi:hypothetical protein
MTLEQAMKRYKTGYADLETINAIIQGLQDIQSENVKLKRELQRANSSNDWEPTMRFFRD